MSVEAELSGLSTHALGQMVEGLKREMERLAFGPELHTEREEHEWPHAAWKACSIMLRAVEAELASRS